MADSQRGIDDVSSILPKTIVARVLKNTIPGGIQFQKDAKSAIIRACTVFINYITAAANEITKSKKAKTLSVEHIYEAMQRSVQLEEDLLIKSCSEGYGEFVPVLKKAMAAHTAVAKERKRKRREEKDGGGVEEDAD
ncbi:hypothetical protein HK101_006358 [Irineochytrium annulatum]|nr:hypothetical protein HK101_006358 [Irineochytrium annulatum]